MKKQYLLFLLMTFGVAAAFMNTTDGEESILESPPQLPEREITPEYIEQFNRENYIHPDMPIYDKYNQPSGVLSSHSNTTKGDMINAVAEGP